MIHHFDLMAPVYDGFMGPPDTAGLRRLLRLPTGGLLLDAGGGTGRASHALAGWTGGTVVVDVSPGMLKRTRGKKGLLPAMARSERLPFPDGAFSRVMVVDALHHFSDQARALADLIRVLAPGGRILIEEFDIRKWPVKAAALAEKVFLMRSRFLPPSEIREIMESRGAATTVEAKGRFGVWIAGDKKNGLGPGRE